MTLPNERTRAIRNARNFLRKLLDPKQSPRVPKSIRKEAYWALKHFPSDFDIMRYDDDIFGRIDEEEDTE